MIRPDFEKWGQKAKDIRDLSTDAEHKRSRERFQALYMIDTLILCKIGKYVQNSGVSIENHRKI